MSQYTLSYFLRKKRGTVTLHDERLAALAARELQGYKNFEAAVRRARRGLKQVLERVERERALLVERREDPEVLVRTGPGPAVEIFHDAERPCGRVKPRALAQGKFARRFLGDVLEEELRPCSACATGLIRQRPRKGAA